MKLFFIKWKRRACLIMITLLLLVGMKDTYYVFGLSTPQFSHVAQASEGDTEIPILSCNLKITCNPKIMTLEGMIDANLKPSKVEIYSGKKWYTSGTFSIKGKQSVYLHYEEKIDRSVACAART